MLRRDTVWQPVGGHDTSFICLAHHRYHILAADSIDSPYDFVLVVHNKATTLHIFDDTFAVQALVTALGVLHR